MARIYTTIGMVARNNGEEFMDELNKKIAELQNPDKGQYVEVQFQTSISQVIALVLQSRED